METIIYSAFVTIVLIYLSRFVPSTHMKPVDNFVTHVKSQNEKLAFAVAFSIIITFVTDYVLFLSLD